MTSWHNVYRTVRGHQTTDLDVSVAGSRHDADLQANVMKRQYGWKVVYRIKVTLKDAK